MVVVCEYAKYAMTTSPPCFTMTGWEEGVLGVPQLLVTRWSGATLSGAHCHCHKDDQCTAAQQQEGEE